MSYLNQKEWNAESSVVWKEIVARFGEADYDDEALRATHQATLKAEYDSQEYARARATEYAALNQFEMQFDDQVNGTTTWIDAINDIKARFPK